jgi:flagellin-like hook-associated protein FlgL
LQTQIGNLQDADLTSAMLELTQAQTQQQAALTARAQMPRTTLFNFLG